MVGYGAEQGEASVWQLQCPVRTQYAGARLASNLALSAHCLEMSFTDSALFDWTVHVWVSVCVCGVCVCLCVYVTLCVCEAFRPFSFYDRVSLCDAKQCLFNQTLSLCLSPTHTLFLSLSLLLILSLCLILCLSASSIRPSSAITMLITFPLHIKGFPHSEAPSVFR